MSSPERDRTEHEAALARLANAVQRAGRHTILFHTAIADRLGISAADSRVLSYVQEVGPVSAGELAELTGVTTGGVTGIIDRLEAAGFVERIADPKDRRKVLVAAVDDSEASLMMERLFAPLGMAFVELANTYDAGELEVISDFVRKATDMLRDETERQLGERGAETAE